MRLSSTCPMASWKSPVLGVPTPGKLFQWMIVIIVKNFLDRNEASPGAAVTGILWWWYKPSFLQGEEAWLLQFFLAVQVLQPFDHLFGPPLDPLQSVWHFLELWGWELNTALQVQPDRHSEEWDEHISVSASHSPVEAAQDALAAAHCQVLLSLCPPAAPGVSQQGCSPTTLH